MNFEGVPLPTAGGGLAILSVMIIVIRLAFKRLDKQDQGWERLVEAATRRAEIAEQTQSEILAATTRRAEAAERTLAELRQWVLAARTGVIEHQSEMQKEMDTLRSELSQAELQIRELQRWEGDKP